MCIRDSIIAYLVSEMGHITVDRISEVGHITLHSLLLVSVLILPSVGYLLWLAAATVDQCF